MKCNGVLRIFQNPYIPINPTRRTHLIVLLLSHKTNRTSILLALNHHTKIGTENLHLLSIISHKRTIFIVILHLLHVLSVLSVLLLGMLYLSLYPVLIHVFVKKVENIFKIKAYHVLKVSFFMGLPVLVKLCLPMLLLRLSVFPLVADDSDFIDVNFEICGSYYSCCDGLLHK